MFQYQIAKFNNAKLQLLLHQPTNQHAIFQPKKPRLLEEMANVGLQRKNTGEHRLSCNARMKEKENGAY